MVSHVSLVLVLTNLSAVFPARVLRILTNDTTTLRTTLSHCFSNGSVIENLIRTHRQYSAQLEKGGKVPQSFINWIAITA